MKKKNIILASVMCLLLILITLGVSYAVFTFSKGGTIENTLDTGTIHLTYTEGKTGITLTEAYPISDEQGKLLTGENNVFDFTVQANLSRKVPINYEVTAVKIPISDTEVLQDDEVKLYLERSIEPDTTYEEVLRPSYFEAIDTPSSLGSPALSMILDKGTFTNQGLTVYHYRLKMWVDEKTQLTNGVTKKFGIKVNVYAKQTGMKMDESCFAFDRETGTITDYSDECIKDVVIPKQIDGVDVVTIGKAAFQYCDLTSVVIPYGVKTIGDVSFAHNQLTSVIIPDSVTTIEGWAFVANRLKSIDIPSSVTSIGTAAFMGNRMDAENAFVYNRKQDGSVDYTSINSYGAKPNGHVDIPYGVTKIGVEAMASAEITSLTIPDTVTTIEREAFRKNLLTTLTIPSSVTSIGAGAFNDNQLPDDQAFIYQRNKDGSIDNTTVVSYAGLKRENVVIPSNVVTIGTGAFRRTDLKSVTIPQGVKTIGQASFEKNLLTEIHIPYGVTKIEKTAFTTNRLTLIDLPDTITAIDIYAFNDNQLPDDQAFIYNRNQDGTINYTSINSYAGANRNDVVIPHGVTTLGGYSLSYNKIKRLTIPDTVQTISTHSLVGNELTTLIIPSSVSFIGTNALNDNPNLKTIINQTGRSFNWNLILTGITGESTITGVVKDIQIITE